MLENRPENALVKLVKTVETVETEETEETLEKNYYMMTETQNATIKQTMKLKFPENVYYIGYEANGRCCTEHYTLLDCT